MIRQLLPLVTGLVTLLGMWGAGNRKAWSWGLLLLNQGLWLAFIIVFRAWGLLLLCLCLIVVNTRNLLKWRREGDPISGSATINEGAETGNDLPAPVIPPWTATNRRESGLVEHQCRHGVGHPAIGSALYQDGRRGHVDGTWSDHGCCPHACCADPRWRLADALEGLRIANGHVLEYESRAREAYDEGQARSLDAPGT